MEVEGEPVYFSQEAAASSQYMPDRSQLQYELTVRQEPKQARMCGIGGKADRRPIDPPVIVQLRVIDPSAPPAAEGDDNDKDVSDDEPPYGNLAGYAQSFLQNPYYFMFASLAKPDDDTELHWLKDGRTRCTTGSVVSSLYALKDPTAAPAPNSKDSPTTAQPSSDAGFFVFPDLSVRTEGSYRLKLSLYEVVGNDVRHCKSIYSAPFYVYTAKKFPGVEESSPLTCSLADQGIKIRIRKDIRTRKARLPPISQGPSHNPTIVPAATIASSSSVVVMPTVDPDPVDGDNHQQQQHHRPAKRTRTDDGMGSNNTGGAPPVGTTPWPSRPLIPPPPGAEIQGQQPPAVIPPPPPPMSSGPAPSQPPDMYDGRYAAYDQSQSVVAHAGPSGVPPVMHPGPPPPPQAGGYPPQYAHPGYYYGPPSVPPAWGPPPPPAVYSDPYHQQYGAPPPVRYDYGHHAYPPPPPAPNYQFYDQHAQAQPQAPAQYHPEYAGNTPPVTVPSNAPPPVTAGPPPATHTPIPPSAAASPGPVMVPSNAPPAGMRPHHPMMQQQQYGGYRPPPGAYQPPPPPPQPAPYYYPQQQPPQPQPQHDPHGHGPAHSWGTPPSGYGAVPPPPVWGQPQPDWHVQQQQQHVHPPMQPPRVELPPLALARTDSADAVKSAGSASVSPAMTQLSVSGRGGKDREKDKDRDAGPGGKKNPLSIGSIISDDREA
ncbi:Velvet domain-containing protein [Mycena chlorophos]|uniref:Velvet domain-containing protein n=1 Tax=Mycena chlorophos TaxID=658473 RepID=A0A8H6TSY0_MYCCL|nr:Velvet domain-containing protein [Mycena chlorophos]